VFDSGFVIEKDTVSLLGTNTVYVNIFVSKPVTNPPS
jgi:hypothetical protein